MLPVKYGCGHRPTIGPSARPGRTHGMQTTAYSAPDCLQPTPLHHYGFWRQVSSGVRPPELESDDDEGILSCTVHTAAGQIPVISGRPW
jgi:hypothetical protein